MDSKYIKACLSPYFRFKQQCKIIATEVGQFNADFVAIRNKELIEVEIKTSRADLNADFKKKKHLLYTSGRQHWIPNYFYFAVPQALVEHAVAKCADNGYGVMVIDDNKKPFVDRVRVVKRSKKLHTRLPTDKVIADILARLSSEMANLRIDQQRWGNYRCRK